MSAILEKIRTGLSSLTQQQAATAADAFAKLVADTHDGKSTAPEAVAKILADAGKTVDHLEQELSALRATEDLRIVAATFDSAAVDLREFAKQEASIEAVYREAASDYRRQIAPASDARREAEDRLQQAIQARRTLRSSRPASGNPPANKKDVDRLAAVTEKLRAVNQQFAQMRPILESRSIKVHEARLLLARSRASSSTSDNRHQSLVDQLASEEAALTEYQETVDRLTMQRRELTIERELLAEKIAS
ncbi:MAG: hypothetical protein AB7O62_11410 [Pirellulales bacterium]